VLGEAVSSTSERLRANVERVVLGKHEEIAKSWDKVLETVKGAIGLDVSKGTYQLGPMLTFNPQRERFVKNKEANAMLTRPYRQPFVVPEQV